MGGVIPYTTSVSSTTTKAIAKSTIGCAIAAIGMMIRGK